MEKKKENKNILLKILSNRFLQTFVAMALISCLLIALVLYGLNRYTNHGEYVVVPSIRGMQKEEAKTVLEKASLHYEIVDTLFLTGGNPGSVLEQLPEENSKVKKGRTIYIKTQAMGVQMITIPLLKDLSQRQAISTLRSLGFDNIEISEIPSAYKGLVIDIKHKGISVEANQKLPKGDPLTLVVGAGGEAIIDSIIDYIPDGTVENTALNTPINSESQNNSQTENPFFD